MIKTILVVCVGNICRSAVGERLLAAALSGNQPPICVASAGLAAVTGNPADPTATEVAAAHGVSLEGHVARQFNSVLGRNSDLILVMEPAHKARIVSMSPELTGKLMLFDQWSGATGIQDPYRRSREFHEQAYLKLEAAAASWAEKLLPGVSRT